MNSWSSKKPSLCVIHSGALVSYYFLPVFWAIPLFHFYSPSAPIPVQSNVDGAKFAAFIDAAVADSIMELGKREDDLSKAGVTMLWKVDGKSMLEQMSPQFLEFVLDAYRSLKYRK